jgi:transposase
MWTTENRRRCDRDKLRYPSDLTDAEWQLVVPLIPPAKRGGGKRTEHARDSERHHVCAEHRLPYVDGPLLASVFSVVVGSVASICPACWCART